MTTTVFQQLRLSTVLLSLLLATSFPRATRAEENYVDKDGFLTPMDDNKEVSNPVQHAMERAEAKRWMDSISQDLMAAVTKIPVVFEEEPVEVVVVQEEGKGSKEQQRVLATPLSVAGTCTGYNTAGFDCDCRRSQQIDVFAECKIRERLCTPFNTTCWEQTFTVILDGKAAVGRDYLPPSVMTTCSKQWSLEQLDVQAEPEYVYKFETCIEVQPTIAGRFDGTLLCGASLDGVLCKSCKQCTTGNSTITVDCCNVAADAKQTCGPVHSRTGITLPQYDPAGSHKGCTGGAVSTFGGTGGGVAPLLLTVASLVASFVGVLG